MQRNLARNPICLWNIFLTIVAFGLTTPALWARAQSAHGDEPMKNLALEGINQMMNGDLESAIATFQRVQKEDPDSPLGYLLEADATWWKIYYTTANLIDPDVFDVVYADTTPDDSHFENLLRTTIEKAKARIRAKQNIGRSYLYEGMAYALEARLDGLRAKDLPTARAGKKMRALLLLALEHDPHLTDAYAGIGLYNYFVDTLPSIVKMLRFLIGLPGGSREEGLQQLQKAAEHGEYTRAEAQFYLAKDFTRRNEMQFEKSLQLFQELAREFPENPFWKLMVGSVEMRLGQRQRGEEMYRQVLAETAHSKLIAGQAVHKQVAQALERLHPGEKFE
jgi:tetratricopeptide (TPR) repeat protein